MSYSYDIATVWIERLSDDSHPMTHDLCIDHAVTLHVPVGWQCINSLTSAPSLHEKPLLSEPEPNDSHVSPSPRVPPTRRGSSVRA